MPRRRSRRTFLASLGTGWALATAGCFGDTADTEPADGNDTTDGDQDGDDDEPNGADADVNGNANDDGQTNEPPDDDNGPRFDAVAGDPDSIHEALEAANEVGGTVYVPAGVYEQEWPFVIREGVDLYLSNGATIKRTSVIDTMLINGDEGDAYGGYEGESNITVQGGVWNGNASEFGPAHTVTPLAFGHAENITVRDVEIHDIEQWHMTEVNAVKNATYENCYFHDHRVGGNRLHAEMLEIDRSGDAAFPWFGANDGTHCRDVTVRNCRFENGMGVGLGTHSTSPGRTYKNITIEHCDFLDIDRQAIRAENWEQVVVSNCYWENCWRMAEFMGDGTLSSLSVLGGVGHGQRDVDQSRGIIFDGEAGTMTDCRVSDVSFYDFKRHAVGFDFVYGATATNLYGENLGRTGVWVYGDSRDAHVSNCVFVDAAQDVEGVIRCGWGDGAVTDVTITNNRAERVRIGEDTDEILITDNILDEPVENESAGVVEIYDNLVGGDFVAKTA